MRRARAGEKVAIFALGLSALGLLQRPTTSSPKPPPKAVVQEVKADNPLDQANAQFAKGNWDAALASYTAFLKDEPKSKVGRFNRAVTLQKLGKVADAQKEYKSLIDEDPAQEGAVLNLGGILRKKGQADRAVKLYKAFLDKKPFSSPVLNNLTVLYREKKDYRKAIRTVRKLLMRDQRNVDAYKNLALVYYDQGKYRLTQTILHEARKLAEAKKSKDPDIHVNFGLTHLALGDKNRAMVSFQAAAEIDPTHVLANYNLAALALEHRDYGLAAKGFKIALTAWPNDFEVSSSYGYALQGEQKLPDAAKQLQDSLKLKTDDEKVILQLVVVYQAMNKSKEAQDWAKKYMRIKGITCTDEDFDGFCGRYNGIKMMVEMAAQPPEPAPEDKPKVTGDINQVFKEGAEEAEGGGEEGAPGGGAEAPPEGGEAPEGGSGASGEAGEPAPSKDGAGEPKPK